MPKETQNQNDFANILKKISEDGKTENTQAVLPKIAQKKTLGRKHWILISIAVVIVALLAALGVVGWYSYTVATQIQQQTTELRVDGLEAYTAFKSQDLLRTQEEVVQIAGKVETISSLYQKLSFYSYVPIARQYYFDGQRGIIAATTGVSATQKSLAAIVPYADVLGFTGEGSFEGGTAEDRLKILLETLDKVAPILDEITQDLLIVEENLNLIDPARYPEKVGDVAVQEMLATAQGMSTAAVSALTEYRPILEELPSIAGARGERKKYIILFQNDNELRPTGGFLTAYAVINVENGKVEAEKSDDIYDLDKKFAKTTPIPPELGRYLTTEKYWNLRDMNISPDYKYSMDQFFTNYKTVKGEPENIDGIIALDTHFVTNLLRVLGPIEVPGYGVFSAENDARCDCPQIIYALSEIITRPTPYIREDRKGIIGPLMRTLLTKAYTAPKDSWPALFETGLMSMQNKHAQLYFLDEKAQRAVELAQLAGRMQPVESGKTDFLAIINANLGGAKSNLFIDYSVKQVVSAPENGKLTKTVEITYKNNRKGDNCNLEAGLLCLNSTLRDWTRLYVPEGSELVSAQGFLEDARTYSENGFTVIDGFFTLEPLGTAKLTINYTVPYTDESEYRLQLWKQGGIESFETLLDVTGGEELVTVSKDTQYQTTF